jgi:uncharacterized cofD-like protein
VKRKKIVVIGGGTGTYTVLSGLKKFPVDLSVIVTMMDSGGSNRVIRDEFGLLPTSDIRQCMVALASNHSSEMLRQLFTYRYNQGTGISGMTFGNLFMAALTDIYGSQEEAIKKTCEILDVKGNILPVTFDNVHLVARYDNGEQVLGEHLIDEPGEGSGERKIVELELIPKARANSSALKAIREADLIVFGPGDLYASVICNLIVGGIAEAIKKSQAKKVYILNLMTKYGQTNGYGAAAHLRDLNKYLGGKVVDIVLVNSYRKFPKWVMARYKQEKACLVKDDLTAKEARVVRGNFVSGKIYKKAKGDKLKRSLIRHDPLKLAKKLYGLA